MDGVFPELIYKRAQYIEICCLHKIGMYFRFVYLGDIFAGAYTILKVLGVPFVELSNCIVFIFFVIVIANKYFSTVFHDDVFL